MNTKRANQSYIYFQSTSNKQKSQRELTHFKNTSFLELAKGSCFLQLGILGILTATSKASRARHRDNLSELLPKRHLWFQQNFSITLPLPSLSSSLRVRKEPSHFCRHQKQAGEGVSPYPGCEVDCGSAVQQQRGHVDIAVVCGDVQRGEAALQRETALVMETFSYEIANWTRTWV